MKKYNFDKDFSIGADISWYPQMIESGFVFKNAKGEEQDLLITLKEYNMDSIRLRVWVDPNDDPHRGHCSAEEVSDFAQKLTKAGYRIMLNFHYSDSWADPGKQFIPAAWEGLDFDVLVQKLYDYTFETMELFKSKGVFCEWVQIGNETNPGMLLPLGSTEDFAKLTRLYNAGNDAVKASSPDSKTMVHLAEFNSTDFQLNYFENLEKHNCRYDMMAFSFYPFHLPKLTYEECIEGFKRSMKEIPERFGKDFMIAEIGEDNTLEDKSYQLLIDAIEIMSTQPKCKGIMWWEPQGARSWSRYPLSAWHDDGRPTRALEAYNTIR